MTIHVNKMDLIMKKNAVLIIYRIKQASTGFVTSLNYCSTQVGSDVRKSVCLKNYFIKY